MEYSCPGETHESPGFHKSNYNIGGANAHWSYWCNNSAKTYG